MNKKSKTTQNSQKDKNIHPVHDIAFTNALKNREVARDMVRHHLPKALWSRADLRTLREYDTKLTGQHLKAFDADCIFELTLRDKHQPNKNTRNKHKNKKAIILCHFEHQSTPTKNMPLRIWQYLLLILLEYQENHSRDHLPLVFPCIIYTGEQAYNYSTCLFDLFGDFKDEAKMIMSQGIRLVDIPRLSDEVIKQHRLVGLAEYAAKHKKTQSFRKNLQTLLPWAESIRGQVGERYARDVIEYLVEVQPEGSYAIFKQETRKYTSDTLGDKLMTMAQELRQEGKLEGKLEGEANGIIKGKAEGKAEGKAQCKREIAQELLVNGVDHLIIAKSTQLSLKDIKALQAAAAA